MSSKDVNMSFADAQSFIVYFAVVFDVGISAEPAYDVQHKNNQDYERSLI
jgi:hypothetical protein